MQRTPTRALYGVIAVLIAAGCPGEIDDPSRFLTAGTGGAACPDVETEIFVTRCSEQAGCHSADDMQGMLDLASSDVASRIVGVPGTSNCGGEVLADPSDPTSSLIYTKLTDTPTCGAQMPFGGGEKLTQTEIDCVEAYIASLPSGGPGAGGGGAAGGMGGAPSGGMGGAPSGGMGGAGGN